MKTELRNPQLDGKTCRASKFVPASQGEIRSLLFCLSRSNSAARRDHYSRQLVSFLQKRPNTICTRQGSFCNKLQPKGGFIRLFFNNAYSRYEFSFAAGSACRPVIRGYRTSRTNDLVCNSSASTGFRQFIAKLYNFNCKSLGPVFQFNRSHGLFLNPQSAIRNPQSAIRNPQ